QPAEKIILILQKLPFSKHVHFCNTFVVRIIIFQNRNNTYAYSIVMTNRSHQPTNSKLNVEPFYHCGTSAKGHVITAINTSSLERVVNSTLFLCVDRIQWGCGC